MFHVYQNRRPLPHSTTRFTLLPVLAFTAFVTAVGFPAFAAVITVGTGGAYDFDSLAGAVATAQANDQIRIAAGIYVNDFAAIDIPLSIEGVGGIANLQATIPIPKHKAILISNADLSIRNIEFRGARVPDQDGAGIRAHAGDLIIENSMRFTPGT